MAANATPLNWGNILLRGAIAGVVGGIVLALFLFVVQIHPNGPFGALLAQLVIAILWGIGYAYVAATRPAAVASPWLAGVVYGLVVWLLMQFILILGAVWPGFSLSGFALQLLAYTAFFGIPVAFTTRALARG